MTTISLAIAVGHDIYRNGLYQLLKSEDGLEVSIETNSFHNLYKKLHETPMDVVLLGSNIKGFRLSSSVSLLKNDFPNLKVLVLANNYNYSAMCLLFQNGINSYLLRNISKTEIVKAIKKISYSDYYFQRGTPSVVKKSILKKQYSQSIEFNDREIEIIQLICEDKSNHEIAEKICLSIRTIEWHRRTILAKMNVKSPVGIIKYALENQLYQL